MKPLFLTWTNRHDPSSENGEEKVRYIVKNGDGKHAQYRLEINNDIEYFGNKRPFFAEYHTRKHRTILFE